MSFILDIICVKKMPSVHFSEVISEFSEKCHFKIEQPVSPGHERRDQEPDQEPSTMLNETPLPPKAKSDSLHNNRDIRVDQNWIERAKMFLEHYFEIIRQETVDEQFRKSDFNDFQLFLDINCLHYFEDIYFRPKNTSQVIKAAIVKKCYEDGKILNPELTEEDFLRQQGLHKARNTYLRVQTQYPKTKLLEIINGLDLGTIADEEGLITIDILDQLFSKEAGQQTTPEADQTKSEARELSLKMILACYLSGYGAMVTSNWSLIGSCSPALITGSPKQSNTNDIHNPRSISLATCPIGLKVNKDYLKILEEWTQMAVDYLVKASQKK